MKLNLGKVKLNKVILYLLIVIFLVLTLQYTMAFFGIHKMKEGVCTPTTRCNFRQVFYEGGRHNNTAKILSEREKPRLQNKEKLLNEELQKSQQTVANVKKKQQEINTMKKTLSNVVYNNFGATQK